MAIYWTYAPAPLALWNTADQDIGAIPLPKTLITEAEWKAALALMNNGYELVNGAGNKPVGQLPVVSIEVQRAAMIAPKLYFHDACRATAIASSTVYDDVIASLSSMTDLEQTRYGEITVFKRLMPEITTYFKNVDGVNLSDNQLDTLFNDAMTLANA